MAEVTEVDALRVPEMSEMNATNFRITHLYAETQMAAA
jgi:hypothetical protein